LLTDRIAPRSRDALTQRQSGSQQEGGLRALRDTTANAVGVDAISALTIVK
jgi:hypothetical protein